MARNSRKYNWRRRGFTLLELMIAITLMLIVMLMLRTMFTSAQAMYVTAARRVQVYSQARVAMDMIEQDMLAMRVDASDASIQLRSVALDDYSNANAPHDAELYVAMDDWVRPEDGETTKIREFLSFYGNATWYNDEKQVFESGAAQIVYYLRKRPVRDDDPRTLDGGYLVRRVLPVREDAEIVKYGKEGWDKARDIEPHEDEIASFVYAVRVYFEDSAAIQYGASQGRTYEAYPEARAETSWLWKKRNPGGAPTPSGTITDSKTGKTVILQKPSDTDLVQFGFPYSGMGTSNPDREFLSTQAEFPSVVMIELIFIDKDFTREDEQGTYRTFSRAIHLPFAVTGSRIDETDRALLSKRGPR